MSQRDDDHIGHVPKITPAHDEIASYQRTKAKGALANSLGEVPDVASAGGSSVSRGLMAFVVFALVATAGWAGYLHQQLQIAEQSIDNYEVRITDLERRLAVTDVSMEESSDAMKENVKFLDSEIRKLWDNVWKRARVRLEEHDAELAKLEKSIGQNQAFITNAKQQFAKTDNVVADLSTQLNQAKQMQTRVADNQQVLSKQQTRLDSAVDNLNIVKSDIGKLDRRVQGTEEWIESINSFRRQVNRDLSTLKQSMGQMQGGTTQ